ncbi:molybdopterin-dependent oxidoreductase [Alkalihalophilus lindianensis]|uniref:Molybdopterin-dependent oxidoreductase n=1 Tax=Alkalihalophilus lindianensis TaxID=1630542 RepID=A0ABU3X6C6_9BACI|nr:molybdopterin-dependent oxidoreductase [Alkalihalophilus lindianensis]MDV2682979.1 molybdopterin-dependent oxidoreductase [Alkalihalophilus lindianensis]
MDATEKVHYRTCPLCEATCGLEIHTKGNEVTSIKGDKLDPFSEGYLCPKGYHLDKLYADPDRIKKPMIREGDQWREVSWQEAFTEVRKGLQSIIKQNGRDAVATYLGNPNVHNLAGMLYVPILLKTLGSKNRYSASTMDQIPKQLTAEWMFGSDFSIPIPDIDRTDYFLVIGANPLVSNGSLMTAPNMRKRMRDLRKRGGKIVVIDPVRTVTAKAADEHYAITPGTDAYLLVGIIQTLFEEELVDLGRAGKHVNGLSEVKEAVRGFSIEALSAKCGIEVKVIRRLAREIATSEHAAVYGRMGTCTQAFGTMNSWLIDVINILTGNLDQEGGVMFTSPAAGSKNAGGKRKKSARYGRFHSRVRNCPEVLGELPTSCLAEEIETGGEGQIKALVTVAGNPVLSAPNGERMEKSLGQLDFMVSVDCYLNETTRHANVLLPAPSALERSHYDLSFYQLSVRNIAHYSKQVFPLEEGQLDEWEVLLQLTAAVMNQDVGADPVSALDDYAIMQLIKKECGIESSPLADRDPNEIFAHLSVRKGPERMLDFLLRTGEYGDFFGEKADGISLSTLMENHPHGLDLGPLKPRLPQVLSTGSGKVELAPPLLVKDLERLKEKRDRVQKGLLLVSRRQLQSNNSWMHNIGELTKGANKCTLQIHPTDAARHQIVDKGIASVKSVAGHINVSVEVTSDVMEGVVTLPHGWGHHLEGIQLRNGERYAGVNSNRLSDENEIDPVSGNAIFNGIPVEVSIGS